MTPTDTLPSAEQLDAIAEAVQEDARRIMRRVADLNDGTTMQQALAALAEISTGAGIRLALARRLSLLVGLPEDSAIERIRAAADKFDRSFLDAAMKVDAPTTPA